MNTRTLGLLAALPVALGLGACNVGLGGAAPDGPVQSAASPSSAAPASVPAALLGGWQLVSLQKTGQAVQPAPAQHTFTADFRSDGRVSLVADCNRCNGGFAAGNATIEVGPIASTRAACSTAPLDTDYAGLVEGAKQWSVSGSALKLQSPAGTVLLRRP